MVTSAVFACVGTAGQRCTTLRRLIVHEDLYDEVIQVSFVCLFVFSFCLLFFLFSLFLVCSFFHSVDAFPNKIMFLPSLFTNIATGET